MISKKQKLLNAIASNNTPLALRIAKDFVIDFDPDQRRILQIAYESQDPSKAKFYTSLGINVAQHQSAANKLLSLFYQTKSQPCPKPPMFPTS